MPDLTTLAAVKMWLAIPSIQTGSDAAFATLISATSADFLRAIDRVDLMQASYTEVREGDGGTRMTTRHWPIGAIASVSVSGAALMVSADRIAPGYYIDATLDPERLNQVYLAGGTVFTDAAPVVLAYSAGYATVPDDIGQAVVEWVSERYKGRPGSQVGSQRDAGGEHVTYDKDGPMPPTTAAVVNRYRRDWPTLDRRQEERDYRVMRINRNYTIGEKAQ